MSSPPKSDLTTLSDDLVERGQTAYRRALPSVLEPSHDGEFVAVNRTQASTSWAAQRAPRWSRDCALEPKPNPQDELSVMRDERWLVPLNRRQGEGDRVDVDSDEGVLRIAKYCVADVSAQHNFL